MNVEFLEQHYIQPCCHCESSVEGERNNQPLFLLRSLKCHLRWSSILLCSTCWFSSLFSLLFFSLWIPSPTVCLSVHCLDGEFSFCGGQIQSLIMFSLSLLSCSRVWIDVGLFVFQHGVHLLNVCHFLCSGNSHGPSVLQEFHFLNMISHFSI